MPNFSKTSRDRLASCATTLRHLFEVAPVKGNNNPEPPGTTGGIEAMINEELFA